MSTTDNDSDTDSNDSGAAGPKDSDSDSGHSSDGGNTGTTATSATTDQGSDDGSNDDSSDEDEEEGGAGDGQDNIVWSGPRKSTPVVIFRPECVFKKIRRLYATGEKYHLAYKMVRTECKVIRQLLHKHGFREVHPNSSDFNLTWIGSHVKPYTLRSLTEFQKINHFPRSYEITRKDRLYKNFQRMRHSKGHKHFDFLPQSFVIPSEFEDFNSAHLKERGTWIVKPVASSRGRGIFLINHPQNLPLNANLLVCRYLDNPMLIDGFKFDCRIYVAVTSYDPLRAYIYEEGLARFATVQYSTSNRTIKNQCMHLTNYSINKKSQDFVKSNDAMVEDYGNKWTLGAMLRYIKKQGRDIRVLVQRIEDCIIKTLLCAEMPVATACKMFMPHRGNCFELYGFDILIDENLKPWVLEVNLSPSLACDAPLDMKIKSNMLGDLFSLVGFMAQDPMMRKVQSKRNQELAATNVLRQQKERIGSGLRRQRPQSAGNASVKSGSSRPSSGRKTKETGGLSAEDKRIVVESKDEYQRRGGWMRVFPSALSMDRYGNFLESRTSSNQMLHSKLYPDNESDITTHSTTPSFVSRYSYARSFTRKVSHSYLHDLAERELSEHLAQWLRKLTLNDNSEERRIIRTKIRQKHPGIQRMLGHTKSAPPKAMSIPRESLAQGKLQVQKETKPLTSAQQGSQETKPSSQGQSSQAQNNDQPPTSSSSNPSSSQTRASSSTSQRPLSGRLPAGQQSAQQSKHSNNSTGVSTGKPPSGPMTSANAAARRVQESGDAKSNVRMVLEVQRGPTKQEIRDSLNVAEIMDHGGDLSKLQARGAFATYLLRVQHRLLEETSRSSDKVDEVTQNDEQMDLVLRFLRRAAGNLQQPFKVIVPSRKLPMHDRRRILAKQLADFVSIYGKETEQLDLRQKMDKKLGLHQQSDAGDEEVIEENRFAQFMTVANESELEELLTTYTKQNKSASIFLGTSTAQPKSINNITSQPASIHHSQSADNLLQRRTGSGEVNRTAAESNPKNGDIYDSTTNPSIPYQRPQSTPNNSTARYAASSYESAVPIYSAKLNRSRPTSAKPSLGDGGDGHGHSSRPTSAVVYRDASGGQIASRHFSESSHQAIQEALQRLAKRQAARQYSANSNQNKNLLTQQAVQQHNNQQLNNNAPSFATNGPVQANHAVGLGSNLGASHSVSNLQSSGRHIRGRTWDNETRSKSSTNLGSNIQSNSNQATNGAPIRRTSSHEHLKQTNIMNNVEPSPSRGQWVQPASSHSSISSTNSNNEQYESSHMNSTVQNAWLQQQHTAASGSAQFHYAMQQGKGGGNVRSVAQQQQKLQEQKQISYDMTQQSRAKHQEQIAQAHSSATALREALQRSAAASASNSHSSAVMLSSSSRAHSASANKSSVKPRPPPNSAQSRKPVSTQRLARTTQEPQGPSHVFYGGVKYNNMTGYSRPSYNTGTLQATVIRH
ncbi:tubulin polyglutamylase TTLL5-like isoform X3 [Amphiura filiformis]|uniref:tubulin polyglutamylase TTLL5-like isoform X3 n=1 Tax=Amphiura filiformis TaxID=82378 RepID=UPI003B21F7C2